MDKLNNKNVYNCSVNEIISFLLYRIRVDIGNETVFMIISVRMIPRSIVFNTNVNKYWRVEEGLYNIVETFPFQNNIPFELKVTFQSNTYMVISV